MEFRKMVDHPGILQDSILALLSHLYLGRAQLMMEDKVAARKGGTRKLWHAISLYWLLGVSISRLVRARVPEDN